MKLHAERLKYTLEWILLISWSSGLGASTPCWQRWLETGLHSVAAFVERGVHKLGLSIHQNEKCQLFCCDDGDRGLPPASRRSRCMATGLVSSVGEILIYGFLRKDEQDSKWLRYSSPARDLLVLWTNAHTCPQPARVDRSSLAWSILIRYP